MAEHFDTGSKKGRGMARRSLDLIDAMYSAAKRAQPITGRGIGYKLFTAGLIPSMARADMQRVYRLLKEARERGDVPWEWIVDETRELERVSTWADPAEYARCVAQSYRRDFWDQQPVRVMVVSEKGTVRGLLRPVLDVLAVGFQVMHGFSSATTVHDISEDDDGRPLIILYVGDFDPSGMFMSEEDLPKRLSRYDGNHVRLKRIALTREHVSGLPSFPATDKRKDPRYKWFVKNYGERCWELDAMDPNDLRACVEREIKKLIEPVAWQRCEIINQAERGIVKDNNRKVGRAMTSVPALRRALVAAGFTPLPLFGKAPPAYGKNGAKKGLGGWQNLEGVTPEQIAAWSRDWPDAINTGILTKYTPALDLDILGEDAARAVEDLVRGRFEEHGAILVRIGRPPKRAILFRTTKPFAKVLINITAGNGTAEKIEFLGDGQQIVVAGTHPDTREPYRWHGGEPGQVRREDLPSILADEAQALVEDLTELLIKEFNYSQPKRKGSGNARATPGGSDWANLFNNIHEGKSLHDSLRIMAAKLIKSGANPGAAVNQLRAMLEASNAPRDDRFRERLREIPRLVDSAVEKFAEAPKTSPTNPAQPCAISDTLAVFDHWLLLTDQTPIYAVLGTVAANLLAGDPVWLGLIGPPSSAKTEILNSISGLPNVVQAATLTPAGLLSGTPKKQHHAGARGGLLRELGEFGIISLKDFGSVLSMRPDAKAEILAALREVYDGAWGRTLGTDGGRTLAWKGKVGLLFGATGVYDSHYSVIGTLGDRFLLSRLAPAGRGQFNRALKHGGAGTARMRTELAESVVRLFAGRQPEPRPIADDEIQFIDNVIMLAVRLRGAVERDRQKREIEAVYGAEGTARIGLALERLLAGLDTLGIERELALRVVRSVGLDSVPPTRRRAYEHLHALHEDGGEFVSTSAIAEVLALPSVTTRRVLEDLNAYGLIKRCSGGQGKADMWAIRDWESEL